MLLHVSRLVQSLVCRSPRKRRSRPSLEADALEPRLLLTAWDATWQYGPPSDATPPGLPPPFTPPGYDLDVNESSVSLIEVPGEGNAPLSKVKIKGEKLSARIKSGDLKGKVKFEGTFASPDQPTSGDTFTGTVLFKFRNDEGKKVTLKFKVEGFLTESSS